MLRFRNRLRMSSPSLAALGIVERSAAKAHASLIAANTRSLPWATAAGVCAGLAVLGNVRLAFVPLVIAALLLPRLGVMRGLRARRRERLLARAAREEEVRA